jgi:hypothetical protein
MTATLQMNWALIALTYPGDDQRPFSSPALHQPGEHTAKGREAGPGGGT